MTDPHNGERKYRDDFHHSIEFRWRWGTDGGAKRKTSEGKVWIAAMTEEAVLMAHRLRAYQTVRVPEKVHAHCDRLVGRRLKVGYS